ncbi:CPBP family intramembrane glutamic endopeptidase [Paraburkholderia adhaesiva]|uniref:CPBP family intramembrane glutamic endopeptidase n=1 Tax=Paraburkholderia adhaesiva TaxID=2883244 RepID=UPI001F3CE4DB|nr:CPBP family intramembrane glutamic endopeptidase [Paraburkholderia adhaesiva]
MRSRTNPYCFPNLLEAFFVVVVLFFVEYLMNSVIGPIGREAGLQPMAGFSIGRVLAHGLAFTVLLHHSKLTYRDLFHDNPSSWATTIGLFALPILLLTPGLLMGMNLLLSVVVRFFPTGDWDWAQGANDNFLAGGLGSTVLVCLIAPIVEEMLFRGIFLRSFLRQYPPGTAIANSAAVFGLAHLNVYQFVVAFGIGLIIGKLYERTRSLLPGILLHACYNTAVVFGVPRASPDASLTDWPASWWLAALTSGGLGTWLLYKLIRTPAIAQQSR